MLVPMLRPISSFGLVLCLSLPVTAMAHAGGEAHSFIAGALHPLSGLDHLLAMLAVGLLAGYSGGNMRWWVPVSFVTAMAVGAGLGATGVDAPLIEAGVAFSLIAFGTALVLKQSLRAPTLVALTVGFALFHGHAHGTEMGTDVSALPYALGFMLATAVLHTIGVLLATKTLLGRRQAMLLKWSGSAIAAAGVVLLCVPLIIPA
jgi:urease accessory protein